MPGLSPDVQVIHHSLAIDSHVEDAQALTVDKGRTRAVPRLNEVQLHTVFAIGHIKLIVQPMTTETERLEEPPITRTADGVMGRALAGLVRVEFLERLGPGMRERRVVGQPRLPELVGIFIAATVDPIEIVVARSTLQQGLRTFVELVEVGRLRQVVQDDDIFSHGLALIVTDSTKHIVADVAVDPNEMRTLLPTKLVAQEGIFGSIVIETDRVTVAIYLDGRLARTCETVGPRVGHDIDHRVFLGAHIIGTIHIIYIQRLFPRSDETLVVERTDLIYLAVGFVRLATSGIVMAGKYPLEVAAHTVTGLLGQTELDFHEVAHRFLAPDTFRLGCTRLRVEVNAAPTAILAIEQLVGLRQLLVILEHVAPIRATPVLDDVPVGAVATVASGDDTHRAGGGVHLTDDVTTFLSEVAGERTLVLQPPHHDRRRVAALLHPAAEHRLEVLAELGRVIPYMGGELRPPEDALTVPILAILEVMRLMGIAEGIEPGVLYLLHTRSHLLGAESMALPELMFVFADAIDEHGLTVEIETAILVISLDGPAQCAKPEGSRHLVRRLVTSLDEAGEAI